MSMATMRKALHRTVILTSVIARANRDVDQGIVLTGHGEFDIYLGRKRHVHEINSGVRLVVRLRHVEC